MLVKRTLLCGVSALTMGVFMLPSFAQEAQNAQAAQSNDDTALETVVVTGLRASLQSALELKQSSDQVVDSITAVDIGALPDRSVAEALQRIPGIQITRTDQSSDPVRWAGYGNGVFIRGLSWVESLTNGHETFGAENGRTISFADVSPNLMSGVDVYKNPDAKMIEGGVGGTVNLRTRLPFDSDGQVVAVSGDLSYGEMNRGIAPSVNMLYSNRWETGIGDIGFLFSADYQMLRTSNNVVSLDTYDGSGTVDGDTVYYPASSAFGYRHMDWKQPRIALNAALQWRPNDQWEVTLNWIFSKAEPQSVEHVVGWDIPTDSSSLASYSYASDGTWTGGTFTNASTNNSGGNDTRYGARHHINSDYSLNVKFTPNDAFKLTIDAEYVDSRATQYDMTLYNKTKYNGWCYYSTTDTASSDTSCSSGEEYYPDAPEINVTTDFSGSTPKISYSGDTSAFADRSNYIWAAAMDYVENNYAHSYATRADASYTFSGSGFLGWLKSVDFGFRSDLKLAVTRNSSWNWTKLNFQTWSNGWISGSTDDMTSAIGTVSSAGTSYYKFPRIFGSSVPGMYLPSAGLLEKGADAVWKVIQQEEAGMTALGATGMWEPLSIANGCTGVEYKCNAIYSNSTGGINRQKENTYAGYFQLNFLHETFLGFDVPVDGNIGVRIVNTQDDSGEGYIMLPSVSSCTVSGSVTSCDDRTAAYNFVGNDGSSLTEDVEGVKSNYTDILPSFNFRAALSDKLQLRLAYSQGLVRPDFTYTRNYTTLSFDFQSNGSLTSGTQGTTGSSGNPYLKPLRANNYDVSLEYYFSNTGSVSLALFHKDISNYFMTSTVPYAMTRNGYSYTFYTTKYVNGDKGKVEGFEFAYQQFFDTLPGVFSGLGLQANYTKIYNSGGHNTAGSVTSTSAVSNADDTDLPMEGMSNDSYNIALMYEKYGISGRLTYNWRSSFLMTSSAANLNEPVWQENYGQMDASLLYTFLDHYKVGLQVSNLLASTTRLDVGDSDYHPRYEWVEGERKFSLVMRANW